MHFENLWEKSEQKFVNDDSSVDKIISDLLIKINLYRSLSSKINSSTSEDANKIKSHLMGEILLTMTHLSYKENINVFEALQASLNFNDIEIFKKMYQSS